MYFYAQYFFRGEKFRTEFSHLDEVIPQTVALTATATKTTRKYIPPIKDNIMYAVVDKPSTIIGEFFANYGKVKG